MMEFLNLAYPLAMMLVTTYPLAMMLVTYYPLVMMLVTISMGRGKMMVEFFSAETEFRVCNTDQGSLHVCT